MITFSLILLQTRGGYTAPYDSTQGVPDFVFIGFWIILLAFGLRITWEFRSKIFPKNIPEKKEKNEKNRKP